VNRQKNIVLQVTGTSILFLHYYWCC